MEDDYALTDVRLRHEARLPGSEAGSTGVVRLDSLRSELGGAKIALVYPLEVGPLGVATGSSLSFHVEADDNDAVRLHQSGNGLESAKWIGGVMQHSVANHHIKRLLFESGTEKIHLHEAGILDSAAIAKAVGQA